MDAKLPNLRQRVKKEKPSRGSTVPVRMVVGKIKCKTYSEQMAG